jgi:hypothetical protein
MNTLHTPDQFTKPAVLLVVGTIGLGLGVALFTRAFDTGSWWQYLGAILLFTLSFRLFKRAIKTRQ